MNSKQFINWLDAQGVQLQVKNGDVVYRGKRDVVSADLLQQISLAKSEILKLLPERNGPVRVAPLSFGQKAIWFLNQMAPESASYNIPFAARVLSNVNVGALEESLQMLLDRHSILRSSFPQRNGEPHLRIHTRQKVSFEHIDASKWSPAELVMQVHNEYRRPFFLEQGSVLRASLFSKTPEEHIFLLTVHHIAIDGWSYWIMLHELGILYSSRSQGQSVSLPRLETEYLDFVMWQRKFVQSSNGSKSGEYWQNKLHGDLPSLDLNHSHQRLQIQSFAGAEYRFSIDPLLSKRLHNVALAEKTTLFTLLAAVFKVLIGRYTGSNEVVIGAPMSGRNDEQFSHVIGYFVNPVALRTSLSENETFRSFLSKVRQTISEAAAHQDYPFPLLVERLKGNRDQSRFPFFQIAFVYQQAHRFGEIVDLIANIHSKAQVQWGGLLLESFQIETEDSQLDLTLEMTESRGQLHGRFRYNTDLVSSSFVLRLSKHFVNLLQSSCEGVDRRLDELEMIVEDELKQLLVKTNFSLESDRQFKNIQALFKEHALRSPDAIAATFGDSFLTYREIDRRSNLLASYLQTLGVGPEVLVAICFDRGFENIVSILAVLKAGGAYLPLDPKYPAERLALVIEDARPYIFITSQALLKPSCKTELQIIYWENDLEEVMEGEDGEVESGVEAGNLAYVIYTSGSTGKPKGVMVEHGGLSNICREQRRWFEIGEGQGVLQFASLSFDASVFEIVMALTAGATLHLGQKGELMPGEDLHGFLQERGVQMVTLPPTALTGMSEEGLKGLKTVTVAGEACPKEVAEQWSRGRKFYNLYGPTETTIWASGGRYEGEGKKPLIGRPIGNLQIYILDRQMRSVPVGVTGEIYIGGIGVTRGYLNQAGLTAERYVPDKIGQKGQRLYRSGDLGRYEEDGQIDYVGRKDQQVKLRGYRIELEEIEGQLRSHGGVKEAVVVVREEKGGHKRLVGYVTLKEGGQAEGSQLREYLKGKLPEYMVPGVIVVLEEMPLTVNGKIDRKQLPEPQQSSRKAKPVISPASSVEQQIADIWKNLLSVDEVSVDDNFFELGGHSLLIVKLQTELRLRFKKEITIVDLFRFPTIASLANHFSSDETSPKPKSTVARKKLTADNSIAIIGMSGRFPGAKNPNELWKKLRKGEELISFFSDSELIAEGVTPEVLTKPNYVRARGILSDIELFDAPFFGLSPSEAAMMDVQHRIFLECAWEAFEDAAIVPGSLNTICGVFAGSGLNLFHLNNLFLKEKEENGANVYQTIIATDKDFLSTRVSYKLNLNGPSVNIQTACSTSLVAVHTACQALLNGECDLALAGAISAQLPQKRGYFHQKGMILSPDGHCRAFDAASAGTVASSGSGVVLLKPLESAIADRNHIYAIIKGSAINNDGGLKAGFTAPGLDGQQQVISAALERAGVEPETISYVEAHGTGTPIGDPIEIAALSNVFREKTSKKAFCAIGSIKTNIGHLDTASGIAGLIKVAMSLKHCEIPPNLHFNNSNPEIRFEETPFFVNRNLSLWKQDNAPRRAGVSSFGIGGTNAHIVVEEAPQGFVSGISRPYQLLTISARTKAALNQSVSNFIEHLKLHSDLNFADAAFSMNTGRKAFKYRCTVVSPTTAECIEALESRNASSVFYKLAEDENRPIAFVFDTAQNLDLDLLKHIYRSELSFRQNIDLCARILLRYIGFDFRLVLGLLGKGDSPNRNTVVEVSFLEPVLLSINYSLSQLFIEWGIRPSAMIGFSTGEYVAALLAGVYKLEDALALAFARGRLVDGLGRAATITVAQSEADVRSWLDPKFSLTAVIDASECIISGTLNDIEQLHKDLDARKVKCSDICTSNPVHSVMVDSILDSYRLELEKVSFSAPKIPMISGLTGEFISTEMPINSTYWLRHIRETARFYDGCKKFLNQPNLIIIEIGLAEVLRKVVLRHSERHSKQIILSLNTSTESEYSVEERLLRFVGTIWEEGGKLDWDGFYKHEQRNRLPLPTYPFQRERFWPETHHAPEKISGFYKEAADAQPRTIDDYYYAPSWQLVPQPLRQPKNSYTGSVLFFVNDPELEKQLRTWVSKSSIKGIFVRPGSEFQCVNNEGCYIRPEVPDDYTLLVQSLLSKEDAPNRIVHFWQSGSHLQKGSSLDNMNAVQDLGFFSLVYLAQALGKQKVSSPIYLLLASSGSQEMFHDDLVCASLATAMAAVKILPLEYPFLVCRSLDFNADELRKMSGITLGAALISKLSPDDKYPMCAFRNNAFWTQSFDSIKLTKNGSRDSRLKTQGVYLITGGLGGIGLSIAKYLAENFKAKVVLISRTVSKTRVAEQIIRTNELSQGFDELVIESIRALGGDVLVTAGDVASTENMLRIKAETEAKFGRINGVIHCAGIADFGGLVQKRNRQSFEEVMRAKINGSLVLDAVFKDELDFLVLSSSLGSAVYHTKIGQIAYNAANEFLDAFAIERNRKRQSFTVSINWDDWLEVGMSEAAKRRWIENEGISEKELGHRGGLMSKEGCHVFHRIVDSDFPHVMVSTRDLNTCLLEDRSAVKAAFRRQQMEHGRPEMKNSYVKPATATERIIVEHWQELLGIRPIGIHDNFFELGGHSLLGIQSHSWIQERFKVTLAMNSLFEFSTIAELACHIDAMRTELDGSLVGVDDLVSMVEKLSDDQIQNIKSGGLKIPLS